MNIRILFIFLGMCHFLFSQEIKKNNYTFTIYSKENGLVDNNINDLKMDSDGYLWLATDNGVSRFDGANFININNTNSKLFFKNGVVNSLYTFKKSILIASKNYGIMLLDRRTLKLSKMTSKGVNSLTISGDTLTYVTNEGMLIVRTQEKEIVKRKIPFGANYSVEIWNNAIFVMIDKLGLYKFSQKKLEILDKREQKGKYGILIKSKSYGLIVETKYNVYTVHENCSLSLTKGLEKFGYVSNYSENKIGKPVILFRNKTPFVPYKNKLIPVEINSGYVEFELRKILPVNNSLYFISTNQGLIKQCLNKNFSASVPDAKFNIPNVIQVRRKIIEGKNDKLYFLGFPGIIELNQKTKRSKKIILQNLSIYDGVSFEDQIYCVVENYGIMLFSTADYTMKQLEDSIIKKDDSYYSIASNNQDLLFLGGNNQIIIYNVKTKNSKKIPLLHQEKVNSLLFDSVNNQLIIGTANGVCIYKIITGNLVIKSKIKLTNKNVKSLLVTNDNNYLFIGTENGLFKYSFNKNRITDEFTVQNGKLENNKICGILEDNYGKIWLSTFSDISILNPKKKIVYHLTKKNGMLNGEYNYKSSLKLKNGDLIFGGLNDYEKITPISTMFKSDLSKFYITSLQKREYFNNEVILYGKKHQPTAISYNVILEQIEISISNLDFKSGPEFSFEYKIDDGLWNNTDQDQLILIDILPYGKHKLYIRMIDPFGNITCVKSYFIEAWVPFYKTNQFLIIIIILVVLLGGILRFVLKREMKKEAQIKNRISMDLHDETGTILTRLLLMIRRKEQHKNERTLVQDGLKEALFSLRAFIDSMSQVGYSIDDLEDNEKEFLNTTFANTEINLITSTHKDFNYKITGEIYRDVKLCIYEATNNCIKYSNAKQFDISIISELNMLTIIMIDDGNLKDINLLNGKGNGIRNIKKRVQRNNGKYRFAINPIGSGLAIELKFPIV